MTNRNDQGDETAEVLEEIPRRSVSGGGGPSLQNPTWNYLHNNYTKIQLQKHCRSLGLTKIWTIKENLIDMIMKQHTAQLQDSNESSTRNEEENEEEEESDITLQTLTREVRKLMVEMQTKDAEIKELKEKLEATETTISLLNNRVSLLEDQELVSQAREGITRRQQPQLPSTKTLILGDTNLSDISSSDLSSDCSIRTVKGATIDILRCWVTERLKWIPGKCMLYGGLYDILDDTPPAQIIDNLGMLVSDLKEMNEDMDIYVCQLVPVLNSDNELQTKINVYNRLLTEWSASNGVLIINTGPPFRIGTGDVDDMCFTMEGENPGLILNRLGVVRLLDTMHKQCSSFDLCPNWNIIKRKHGNTLTNQSYERSRNMITAHTQYDNNSSSRRNSNRYPHNYPNNSYSINHEPRENRGPIQTRREGGGQSGLRPSYLGRRSSVDNRQFRHQSGPFNRTLQQRRGCYNCGEFNHQQPQCRYDHKIRCENCHSYGHKRRLCNNYNEAEYYQR